MSEVFVIRNQHGHYWGKAKVWVDGSDAREVLRLKHQDEGVNSLVELSSRDVALRGEVLATELDSRGHPLVKPSQIPLPGTVESSPGTETPGPQTENQPTPEAAAADTADPA